MFEVFRKMIVPIIIVVLLFFTAMIVLEWGLGFTSRQSFQDTNLAAIINGEEVGWTQYNSIYNGLLQGEMQNSPDGEVPQQRRVQLHDQAWQQMLHDRLLMQEVAKKEITVAPEEIYSFLKYSPPPELQTVQGFQTDGKFDYQKYIAAMADPQAAAFWASLEPFVRNEIMKLKMQEMVLQAVSVSEDEVKSAFMDAHEQVKVGMVNVAFDRFSRPSPEVTDEDLHAYFDKHRDDYYLDERRGLNIALLEKEPRPYDWEVSFNKAKQIYDSIKAGADFGEMAKRYSTDGSAQNGGDLGWFNQGQMVAEFDRMAFSLAKDAMSEPVRTQFGWHIIKLHDKKEEKETLPGKTAPELVKKAHASHILIKAELTQESKDELYNKLEAFRQSAERSGFLKAIEDHNIPLRQASPFFREGNIQFLGRDERAGSFAFENELNTISDLMENNSSFYVIQVSEIKPAGPASFEDAKQKLELDVLTDKVLTICKDTAAVIWSEVQAGADLEKAAKKHGEEYTVMDPFKRIDFVKELRRDPKAIGTAFSLQTPGELHMPTEHGQGVTIFKLIEKITPDLSEYNSKKDSVYATLMTKKQQELYTRWFEELIAKSEIVNNVEKALAENPDFM